MSRTDMIDDDILGLISNTAHMARQQKRFDESRYLFERLAVLCPDRAFPYVGLGFTELDRHAFRSAARMFRCALDRVPDYVEVSALLGMSLIEDRNYRDGVRVLESVLPSGERWSIKLAERYLALPACAPYRKKGIAARRDTASHSFIAGARPA